MSQKVTYQKSYKRFFRFKAFANLVGNAKGYLGTHRFDPNSITDYQKLGFDPLTFDVNYLKVFKNSLHINGIF